MKDTKKTRSSKSTWSKFIVTQRLKQHEQCLHRSPAKDQTQLGDVFWGMGVWELQNKRPEVKSWIKAGSLCSAQDSLPGCPLSLFCLRQFSKFSLAVLKILWIAHLWQVKSSVASLHITSVIIPGSLLIFPWISIPWPHIYIFLHDKISIKCQPIHT